MKHVYMPLSFEIILFVLFCFVVYKIRTTKNNSNKKIMLILLVSAGLIAVSLLTYIDLIKFWLN